MNHISGMQPTRQNEPDGARRRNERPIEDLSTAAESLDIGVEQEGLGVPKRRAKSSKSKPGAIRAARRYGRPDDAQCAGVSSPWNCSSSCGIAAQAAAIVAGVGIDEQPDRRDERRQAARQLGARASVTWRGLFG